MTSPIISPGLSWPVVDGSAPKKSRCHSSSGSLQYIFSGGLALAGMVTFSGPKVISPGGQALGETAVAGRVQTVSCGRNQTLSGRAASGIPISGAADRSMGSPYNPASQFVNSGDLAHRAWTMVCYWCDGMSYG
jgi:hypothetical protein